MPLAPKIIIWCRFKLSFVKSKNLQLFVKTSTLQVDFEIVLKFYCLSQNLMGNKNHKIKWRSNLNNFQRSNVDINLHFIYILHGAIVPTCLSNTLCQKLTFFIRRSFRLLDHRIGVRTSHGHFCLPTTQQKLHLKFLSGKLQRKNIKEIRSSRKLGSLEF